MVLAAWQAQQAPSMHPSPELAMLEAAAAAAEMAADGCHPVPPACSAVQHLGPTVCKCRIAVFAVLDPQISTLSPINVYKPGACECRWRHLLMSLQPAAGHHVIPGMTKPCVSPPSNLRPGFYKHFLLSACGPKHARFGSQAQLLREHPQSWAQPKTPW